MRRGLAALALVFVGAGFAASLPPSLRLVSRQPLVVRGAHFAALERVTLTASSVPARVARTHATRAGTFRVAFARTVVRACGPFVVRAVGSRGSVAAIRIPLPACMAEQGPARMPGG
jgi:hypothetical protein